jgi:glycosyltransferase involved in cell wall biosynthesis
MKIAILAPNKGPPFDEAWTKEVRDMSEILKADVLCTGDTRMPSGKNYRTFSQGVTGTLRLLFHTVLNQPKYDHIHISENPNTRNGKMITVLLLSGLLKRGKCSADFSSEWLEEKGSTGLLFAMFMKGVIPKLRFVNIKSEAARKLLMGLARNIVFVNGVDVGKFSYARPKKGSFKILFASAPTQRDRSFIERKGIDILLKAVARAVRDGADISVRMLLRGSHREEIESLIDSLKLSDNVEIIDRFIDINEQIGWSHITAFTPPGLKSSRNYPMSVMESLASGKPVVVSDVLEISGIVLSERCGEVCRPDVEGIMKAIHDCMKNYGRLSSNCTESAKRYFNIRKSVHDMKRFL